MNKKYMVIGIMAASVALSAGLIGTAVFNGKYLEAIAISGVISTFAWFVMQGKETRRGERGKIVARDEQVEEREG